jgi:hypothetical protein
MFWILNKKTQEPGNASSVVALSNETGVKENSLYEHFGRKKLIEFNDDNFRICKTEVLKSKRK